MRAMFSIFLLTIHLFTATELNQLFKLPVLLEHFNEHQQKDPSISFSSFLYRHYFTDHTNDGHQERDNQLPFHSHDDCVSFKISVCTPMSLDRIELSVLPTREERKLFSFFEQGVSSSYLSAIWQPPKKA